MDRCYIYFIILGFIICMVGCTSEPKEGSEYDHRTAEYLCGEYISYDTIYPNDKYIIGFENPISAQAIEIRKDGLFKHIIKDKHTTGDHRINIEGYLNDYADGSWIELLYNTPELGDYSEKIKFDFLSTSNDLYLIRFNKASDDYYTYIKLAENSINKTSLKTSFALKWLQLQMIFGSKLFYAENRDLYHPIKCTYSTNSNEGSFTISHENLSYSLQSDDTIELTFDRTPQSPINGSAVFSVISITRNCLRLVSTSDPNNILLMIISIDPYPWSTMQKLFGNQPDVV